MEHSHDDGKSFRRVVELTHRSDHFVAAPTNRAQIDEQNLILDGVDLGGQVAAKLHELAVVQLAAEYGILNVVAPSAHHFVDASEATRVADVVTHDVHLAHGSPSLVGRVRLDLTQQELAQ